MDILILIIIFILARIIAKGLFDRDWRAKSQDNIDSIKNEKIFWYLMSQKINAPRVFFAYLRTRDQKDYIRVYDCVMNIHSSENETDKTDLDIKTITKSESIRLINSTLNPKIQEKETAIRGFLTENKITFTEDEIRKKFQECFDEHLLKHWKIDEVQKHYPSFMSAHLDSLIKSYKTGIGVWEVLKGFVDKEHELEFDGGKYVDFLESLKMLQNDLNNFVSDLLCNKVENKEKSQKLNKLLTEWRQLHMLRWCIADFSVWKIGKNKIQTGLWRMATSLFL